MHCFSDSLFLALKEKADKQEAMKKIRNFLLLFPALLAVCSSLLLMGVVKLNHLIRYPDERFSEQFLGILMIWLLMQNAALCLSTYTALFNLFCQVRDRLWASLLSFFLLPLIIFSLCFSESYNSVESLWTLWVLPYLCFWLPYIALFIYFRQNARKKETGQVTTS